MHHTVSFWRNILQVGKLAELGLEEESENQQLSVKTPSRLLTWYNEAVEVLSSDGLTSSRSTSGVLTDHNTTKVGGLSYARFYKKSAGLSSQFRLFVTIEAVNFVAGA